MERDASHLMRTRSSTWRAVDDRTATYILDTRKAFDNLRDIASQLAGLLVLAASGARSTGPHHPVLEMSRQTLPDIADDIRRARPTDRARQHHRHLSSALECIDVAVRTACRELPSTDGAAVDRILRPLRDGYAHLQNAANRLPGFELIAFSRGCCVTGRVGQSGRVGLGGTATQSGRVRFGEQA
jgi:hypothetical protein